MGILKKNSNLILVLHQLFDLLLITAAFWAALVTRGLSLNSPVPYLLIYILSIICCHISLRLFGTYDSVRNQKFSQIFSKIIQASLTGTAGIIFIMYLLHMEAVSRLFLAFFTTYLIVFSTIAKSFLYYTLRYNRHRDYNTRKVLIIGSRCRAIDLISEILKNPGSGYRISGCLETADQKESVGKIVFDDVSVTGTMDDFNNILLTEAIDEILFAIPLKQIDNIHKYILFAENMGINVRIMPDFQIQRIMYYPETAKIYIDSFLGMPTMSLSSAPSKDTELITKAIIDFTAAGLGILLLSPLLILISLAIKLTSKGPVLFAQTRCGLNGRHFTLYKFRTMVANAEELKEDLSTDNEMDGPVFKMRNDPRITPIGYILRKASLDELPQLFNILKGEMSLVGPRPPLPSEVEQYHLWQRRKLSMKPGLTCIWQVSGRNDVSFEQWMKMDLEYIDNWSLLLDFKLLGLTAKEVTFGGGH
ncbi:MAG: sugar transferase [Proteobacteria bacterium]|nr:sugar transferase [Pseudomonadota bacterium]MBU1420042.1 sugar transferase [Pseudomonadota bacterium]MBU1454850.1 sugar transferase [Pseudomonadota bacterium]